MSAQMSIQSQIEEKLNQALQPSFLEVINESHMHSGTATESHFKVVIASTVFEGQMLIKRHRAVNKVLADELNGHIHALSLHTMTPDEYFASAGKVNDSPQCQGGSKA